eukprot:1860093-Rhodomonas_salina.3
MAGTVLHQEQRVCLSATGACEGEGTSWRPTLKGERREMDASSSGRNESERLVLGASLAPRALGRG